MRKSNEVNDLLKTCLEDCQTLNNDVMTVEHFLSTAIISRNETVVKYLAGFGCHLGKLMNDLNGIVDRFKVVFGVKHVAFAEEFSLILKNSEATAQYRDSDTLEIHDLLYNIIVECNNKRGFGYDYLQRNGLDYDRVISALNHANSEDESNEKFEMIENNNMDNGVNNDYGVRGGTKKDKQKTNETPMLDANGKNLNLLAKEGKLQRIIGREKELERMMHILMRKKKRNPLIVGEAGVGKTTLAEALANKIVSGDIHAYFKDKTIYLLDLVSVVSGTKFRGEFEKKMLVIIKELVDNPNIIVFIDEIHQLVGSGSTQGSMDGSNIIKPELASGAIQVIGSTTNAEFKKHFENDKALVRRFQKIQLSEPTPAETIEILKGVKDDYEEYHGVMVSDEIIEDAVKLSGRLVHDRFFPDKAFDLLDEVCAYVNYNKGIDNQVASKVEFDRIKELKAESLKLKEEVTRISKTGDYFNAANIRDKNKQIIQELTELEAKVNTIPKREATRADLMTVTSKLTGASLETLDGITTDYLTMLETNLNKVVIGQKEAVATICDGVLRHKSRVKDPNKPLVYLFLGQTGTGKTLLTKEVAKMVYGSASNFIRINMSDYQDAFTATNITGSPKGYVGHEEGSALYEKVKNNPNSIILLDEVEKAHTKVFNAFLQIFDEGEAIEHSGEKVSFRECIFVMTSNIGMRGISENKDFSLFSTDTEKTRINELIMEGELKQKFSPELLNRISKIVTFNNISEENAKLIVELEITKINERLSEIKKSIVVKKNLLDLILKEGYSTEYGARNINRTVEKLIESPLSKAVINDSTKDKFVLDYKKGEVVVS